jgi:hypothetical protein
MLISAYGHRYYIGKVDCFFSKTYEERLNKKIFIRSLLCEINRKIPLDILVYSKAELNLIKERGNYFIDEVERTGKIIYEKAKAFIEYAKEIKTIINNELRK